MIRGRLLCGAFAPAALIGGLRIIPCSLIAAAVLLAFAALAVLSLIALVRARSLVEPSPFAISEVADESAQVPAFLLTYLFPFVSLTITTPWDAVAYGVFVLILLVVLLRTELVLVNPVLLLGGLRIYRARNARGTELILFADRRLRRGDEVVGAPLSSGAAKFVRFANREV